MLWGENLAALEAETMNLSSRIAEPRETVESDPFLRWYIKFHRHPAVNWRRARDLASGTKLGCPWAWRQQDRTRRLAKDGAA